MRGAHWASFRLGVRAWIVSANSDGICRLRDVAGGGDLVGVLERIAQQIRGHDGAVREPEVGEARKRLDVVAVAKDGEGRSTALAVPFAAGLDQGRARRLPIALEGIEADAVEQAVE